MGKQRVAHRLTNPKGNGGHPELLVCVDTETWPDPSDPDYQVLSLGWATFTPLGGGRERAREREFTTPAEFWDLVEYVTQPKRILWVVGANIFFDMRVLEWESQLTTRGWEFTHALFPDPNGPFLITARRDGHTIKLANLSNWWGIQKLATIGKSIGFEKEGVDPTQARFNPASWLPDDRAELSQYCRQDTLIVQRAMEIYIRFCRSNNLGPFAVTLAGQAFTAWRHRFLDEDVFVHDNVKALSLERDAYNGGLTDCWYTQPIEPPPGEYIYHDDVNSLYPSIMRGHAYPVGLISHMPQNQIAVTYDHPVASAAERVSYLHKMAHDKLVIARVVVDTTLSELGEREQAMLPKVYQDRLCYPIGQFETPACTPELVKALDAGIVVDVLEMAVYQSSDTLFDSYVEFFYGERERLKAIGNEPFRAVCKLFMNALYGKFGQRNYEWSPSAEHYLTESGIETFYDYDTGEAVRVRRIGQLSEVRSHEKKEAYNSVPAIAAHTTAYARSILLGLRAAAGYDHTYYGDTDSVVIDSVGHARLNRLGLLDEHKLGGLKLEHRYTWAHFPAPKCYRTVTDTGESYEKKKGIRQEAKVLSPDVFQQVQFQGAAGALRDGNLNRAKITKIVKRLSLTYNKGTNSPEGWTRPHVLTYNHLQDPSQEDPPRPHPRGVDIKQS